MSNKVVITPMDDYIYVEISDRGNYDEVLELWQNIAAACHQHQCFNVLGVQRSKMAVDTLTALDHHTVFTDVGIDHRYRIAWVDENPRTFETIEFIKNVLANRSIAYGRIFSDESKAKTWLLSKPGK